MKTPAIQWMTGVNFPGACSGGGAWPHAGGQRQRLVGAVLELNRHENQFLVAQIFEVVHLELAGAVALVPGLAGSVGIFDGAAVVDMLAATSAADRSPEIIQHVAV